MKQWLLIFCIFAASNTAFANMGAFLVLKSTYLYTEKGAGSKQLTRKKEAYPVVGISRLGDKLLYQVLEESKKISTGTGFVVETDQELQAKKEDLVKVYLQLPQKNTDLKDFQLVPTHLLLATGAQEQSQAFPELEFRAVSYQGAVPKLSWVYSWAGIYRPDKSASFLNLVWSRLEQGEYTRSKVKRIMMGLVEIGYSKSDVKLALGAPLKEEALPGGELQWVYPQKKVVFNKGKVTRTL